FWTRLGARCSARPHDASSLEIPGRPLKRSSRKQTSDIALRPVPLVDMAFRQPDHFSVQRRICSISGNPLAYMQGFWHTIAVLPLLPFMPFVPICPSDTDDTDDISDNSHILILLILIRFLIAAP
ncbi:MAG: hypothetical protein JNM70_04530, partial [Anaerolineae bacterium]|nr:hypothetical protein [Anaerolineae bacterium]